jgi:amino acid transporter
MPVVIFFFVIGWVWKGKPWIHLHEIDIDTGRRELPWDDINAHRAELAAMPAWKRLIHTFFI